MKALKKLLLLTLTPLSFLAHDKITIANGEWPPYFSQELKNYGQTSHIVTEAFKLSEIKIEYKWYPWKRAFHLTKTGKIDATVGWSKTKQREKHFIFSDPILEGKVVFFHLKSFAFQYDKLEELKNLKIGTIVGYDYGKSLDKLKNNKNIKLFETIKEKKLFELLLNSRFDLVIMNLNAGYGILNRHYKDKVKNVTYNKKPLQVEKLRVLFNKNNKYSIEYKNKFNIGLKKVKETGLWDRVYKIDEN